MLKAILIVVPIVGAALALLVFAVRRHLDGPTYPSGSAGNAAARDDVAAGVLIADIDRSDGVGPDGGGDGGGSGD